MIVQLLANILLQPTAYIDPSSGGFLFQMLAVAFTFLSGLIILFSNQIRHLWARLRGRNAPKSSEEQDGGAASDDDTPAGDSA